MKGNSNPNMSGLKAYYGGAKSEQDLTEEKRLKVVLAERLREIRASRSLSQEECALAVDIPWSNFCRLENGKSSLNLPTIFKIAEALEISLDFLTGRTRKQNFIRQ